MATTSIRPAISVCLDGHIGSVDGRMASRAIYAVLALNMVGKTEILGLYTSATEAAQFIKLATR
jgi:transposase-like protein